MEKQIFDTKYNTVIVKPIEREEQKSGGIIIPDMGKETALRGVIVSIGEFYWSATGAKLETQYKVGDEVLMPQMGPVKFEYEGQEYYALAENTILTGLKIKK